jgi:hypothetical protein
MDVWAARERRISMARWLIPALVLCTFVAWPSAAFSAGGSLDSTFGNGGKVVTDFTTQADSASPWSW